MLHQRACPLLLTHSKSIVTHFSPRNPSDTAPAATMTDERLIPSAGLLSKSEISNRPQSRGFGSVPLLWFMESGLAQELSNQH